MSLGSANCTKVVIKARKVGALTTVCVAAVTLRTQGEQRATVRGKSHTGQYRICNYNNDRYSI